MMRPEDAHLPALDPDGNPYPEWPDVLTVANRILMAQGCNIRFEDMDRAYKEPANES